MPKSKQSNRRGLLETLRNAEGPLLPEKLFSHAGYTHETVDEFYAELKEEIVRGTIRELRAEDSAVTLQAVEQ